MSLSSKFTNDNLKQLHDEAVAAPRFYVRNAGVSGASAGASLDVADAGIAAGDIVIVTSTVASTTAPNGFVTAITIDAGVKFTISTVGDSSPSTYNYVVYRAMA